MLSTGIRRLPSVAVAAAAAGALAFLATACGLIHLYRLHRDGPTTVARAFLDRCYDRQYDALRHLFDSSYRDVFTPQASRQLLQRIHENVPRTYSITMHNHPNTDGMVNDWDRYCVRCQFEEPPEAQQAHKCFVITLARQQDGSWRIAFMPTYLSLFGSLYDDTGESFLRGVVQESAGGQSARLCEPPKTSQMGSRGSLGLR
jgi:hypothetical protein